MGAYVSKTPAGQGARDSGEEAYATAEVHAGQAQKEVTFANPPASEAKPRARDKPAKAAQPVLKRQVGKPRANRTSGAVATPSSASKRKSTTPKGKRSPRGRSAVPSPAAAPPATPAAASATAAIPKVTPKSRGRPAGVAKRFKAAAVKTAAQTAAVAKSASAAVSATVANAAHELVVIGKSIPQAAQSAAQSTLQTVRKQRNALPAQKVNMKRVSKRRLRPVGQRGGSSRKV